MKKLLLILAILPLFAIAQTSTPHGYDNMESVERGGLRALESIRFPYKSSSTWLSVHSDIFRNTADSVLKFYDIKSGTDKPIIVVDGNGKIPLSYMSDALIGSVNYQGTYSAGNDLPELPDAAPANKGHYYIVSDTGYVVKALDSFFAGDWIISSGSAWGKVDNNNKVASVFGRIGSVVAQSGDYSASQVTGAIAQGGNTFGVPMVIGPSDNNMLTLQTNGTSRMHFSGSSVYGGVTPSNQYGYFILGGSAGSTGFTVAKSANTGSASIMEIINGSDGNSGNLLTLSSNIGGNTAVRSYVAKDGSVVSPSFISYNTADQTTNYERFVGSWAANTYSIRTESGGTANSRNLQIGIPGVIYTLYATNPVTGKHNFALNGGSATWVGIIGNMNGVGMQNSMAVLNTINQTGAGGYRGLWISPFEQATGSGSKYLIDAGTNSAANGTGTHSTKFAVDHVGNARIAGTIQSNTLMGEGDRMAVAAADGSLKTQPLPEIPIIQEIEIVVDEEDVYASVSTNGTSAYVKKDGEYYNYAGGWNTTNLESDIGTFIYQIKDDSYLSINVDDSEEKKIKSLTLPASLPKLKSLGISGVEDPINTDFTAYTGLEDLKLTDLDATGSSVTAANITKKLRLINVIGFTTPLNNFINVKGLEVSGMSYVAVDVSNLTKLTSLSVYSNEDLTTVTLPVAPNLREIDLNDNPSLFTINIPSGALAGCKQLSVQNCNLSAEAIDAILIALDDSGSENGSGYFYGNASPTSAGEAAWDNLASKGWSIFLPE